MCARPRGSREREKSQRLQRMLEERGEAGGGGESNGNGNGNSNGNGNGNGKHAAAGEEMESYN